MYGTGSAYQEIPRGAGVAGTTNDRQFTDQCSPLEQVGAVDNAAVLMRHRSCHFCDCRMRLDPMDRANRTTTAREGDNKGPNPCAYEIMCGPADNIVHVPRKQVKGTRRMRSDSMGRDARAMISASLNEG